MTVITAAVESNGVIHMCADRLICQGDLKYPDAVTKVSLFAQGRAVLGVSGFLSVNQAAARWARGMNLVSVDVPTDQIPAEFMRDLVRFLKAEGLGDTENPGRIDGFTGLLGFDGALYHVYADGTTIPIKGRRFHAIGSGGEIAMGALDVLIHVGVLLPRVAVRHAVRVAARHINTCDHEYTDLVSTVAPEKGL